MIVIQCYTTRRFCIIRTNGILSNPIIYRCDLILVFLVLLDNGVY